MKVWNILEQALLRFAPKLGHKSALLKHFLWRGIDQKLHIVLLDVLTISTD